MPPLSPENLPLVRAALPLLLFVHFTLLGAMLASVSAALFLDAFGRIDHRPYWRDLAVELVLRTVPPRGLVLLPMATALLALVGVQLAYPPLLPTRTFWVLSLAPLLFSLAALAGYRRLLPREGGLLLTCCIGAAGVLPGLLSCFLLCCGGALLVLPERWALLSADPRLALSWIGFAKYLEFTSLSFAAAGGVVLLIGRRGRGVERPAGYPLFLQRSGIVLALVFLPILCLSMLLKLANLPAISLSGLVFAEAAASSAVAGGAALLLFEALCRGDGNFPNSILLLLAALFALWALGDHLTRENALRKTAVTGVAGIGGAAPPAQKEPKQAQAPPGSEKEEKGEEIFERVCSMCHRFDEKLIGPPLDSVLPSYRGDVEALKSFIRQPVKKNPEYPAMPPPGLKEEEIDAVARFLLARPSP